MNGRRELERLFWLSYSPVGLTLTPATKFPRGVYNWESYLWPRVRFQQFGFHKFSISDEQIWPAFHIFIDSCRGPWSWDESVNGFSESMLIAGNKFFAMNWTWCLCGNVAICFPSISSIHESEPSGMCITLIWAYIDYFWEEWKSLKFSAFIHFTAKTPRHPIPVPQSVSRTFYLVSVCLYIPIFRSLMRQWAQYHGPA